MGVAAGAILEPLEVIKIVEKRVEVPVEVVRHVDRILEKRVEVPVEVIRFVDRIVEIEKRVEVPVEVIKFVERPVEKPVARGSYPSGSDAALQPVMLLSEAIKLRDEGKLHEALKKAEALLKLDPSHEGARELRNSITYALEEAARPSLRR